MKTLLLLHRNEGAAAIDAARHHKFAWSNKHSPKGSMAGIAMHESDVNQIITVFEYLD